MHMSNKGRLETDRALLRPDRKEHNLNSLDFEEFKSLNDNEGLKCLTKVIEYEKRCCEHVFVELERVENENENENEVVTRLGTWRDSQILRFQYFFSDLYSDRFG